MTLTKKYCSKCIVYAKGIYTNYKVVYIIYIYKLLFSSFISLELILFQLAAKITKTD